MKAGRAFFFPERGALLRRPYAIVAALGLAAGVALAVSDAGQRVEWYVYDQYARQAASRFEPAPGLVVVALDETSFAEIGLQWPWPRSIHAALVDQLVRAGARTIAFDIVFDTEGADADDDREFAAAIGRAGNVILAANRAVVEDRHYAVEQWIEPLPLFAEKAAAVAGVGIPYDDDSVLRRAQLVDGGRPSFALAIASRAPGFTPPPGLDLTTAHLFRYNGPPRQGITTVSYYQALDASGSLPPGIFAGKDVIIGRALEVVTIDTNVDHFTTPVAVRQSGGEVHATIVDALYRHRFIADPFSTRPRTVALCALGAIAAALVLFVVSPQAGAAIVAAAIAGMLLLGYAAYQSNLHLPVAGPSLAMAVAAAVCGGYRVALAASERRLIKRAFQHYVAPAIVERMLNDPSQLKLGGEQYEITVLFTDLEGFTTLSERLSAAELSRHLGEYFTEMLDVLLPHQGTLDKLIGDSIMMYFGCPLPDREHAVHACRGALAMQRRMAEINERWSALKLPLLRTRVGINTGVAVAGNMGTTTIFNYTVLGDSVNLASRLEGVNKEYGTLIIVGEDTWRLAHESFEGRELDWIRVKGRAAPVAIYELAGERGAIDAARRELFRVYGDGLRLYRAQQWADAAQAFRRALDIAPGDGPSGTLLKRCVAFEQRAPGAWDGVHAMAPG